MKKLIAMLLALAMLLSLAACGGSAPAETEAPETAPAVTEAPTEATTEPTTEPTLSPEEILYNSLPDRMKQAVDVGIVELSQLEDLERIVTVGEASEMLQEAYVHRTGVESKTLNDLISREEFASRTADRAWVSQMPGLADLELAYGDKYESYEQWMDYLDREWAKTPDLWSGFDDRLGIFLPVIGTEDGEDYRYDPESDSFYADAFGSTANNAVDYRECMEQLWYGDDPFYPNGDSYGFKVYDSTNGKKFFSLQDGYINGTAALTVEDTAEYALIYYNFPNPMAYPDYVAVEEVGAYNPEIITPDLLEKETTLPDASCENLPKEWHGVVMDDMEMTAYDMHTDPEIYEYEIKAVKEAGFNYIGLNVDFSWLQDYKLFDRNNNSGNNAYKTLIRDEDDGKLSLQRLEKLDQVIAWCMKYDIHVNLRATALGSTAGYSMDMGMKLSKGVNYAPEVASFWQALARRYADIPNNYLSFTLFTSGLYEVRQDMLPPAVDAIREVSPERCIIADICNANMKAETFAELGVALSYRLNDHLLYDKILNLKDYYKRSGQRFYLSEQGKEVVENFTWPYKGELDAKMLFSGGRGETLMSTMETAQEYGVGFMLSDFGVAVNQEQKNMDYAISRLRYADEPYFAMITDITSTMTELGYGWCFAHWYSPYGVAFCLPAIKTATYTQIEDYPYYIDQGMMGLFQSINGVQ